MIRVIFALLLLMACAAAPQLAYAQQGSQECDDFDDGCDEGTAYMVARQSADDVGPILCQPTAGYPTMTYYAPKITASYSQSGNSFAVAVYCRVGSNAFVATPRYFMHYFVDMCSQRSDEFNWKGGPTAASVNVCYRGCMYTSALDAGAPSGHMFSPTGATCAAGDAPEPVEITPGEEEPECEEGEKEVGGVCVPDDGGGTNPGNPATPAVRGRVAAPIRASPATGAVRSTHGNTRPARSAKSSTNSKIASARLRFSRRQPGFS